MAPACIAPNIGTLQKQSSRVFHLRFVTVVSSIYFCVSFRTRSFVDRGEEPLFAFAGAPFSICEGGVFAFVAAAFPRFVGSRSKTGKAGALFLIYRAILKRRAQQSRIMSAMNKSGR